LIRGTTKMNSSESFLVTFALFGILGWAAFRYGRRYYPTATLIVWALGILFIVVMDTATLPAFLRIDSQYLFIFLAGPVMPFLLRLSWIFWMGIFGIADQTTGSIMSFGDKPSRDPNYEPPRMPSLFFNRNKKD